MYDVNDAATTLGQLIRFGDFVGNVNVMREKRERLSYLFDRILLKFFKWLNMSIDNNSLRFIQHPTNFTIQVLEIGNSKFSGRLRVMCCDCWTKTAGTYNLTWPPIHGSCPLWNVTDGQPSNHWLGRIWHRWWLR